MSDNIKVVVKVRPLISREIEEKLSYQWRVKNNSLYQLDQNGKDFGANFTFDKVYDRDTKTCDVYNDIAKPIVEAAIAGFNGTIFAYGQTSSGKTYTMSGTKMSPGIIPLAVLNLFEIIKKIPDRDFLVRVSYIEIYNETLKDLLNVEKKVKICETFQGVKLDATEKVTSTPEDMLDIMKEGEVNRQIGATNMNEESSRSHSIFQITIESREHIEGEEEVGSVNVSTLNLVDLAGSERAGQTGATGIRFKEGTHINKSLSVLALVIKQLSEGPHKHINYRDSRLTRILQNSLGGNAKTSIICAVTPAAVEETISTLQFANRAKSIKNKPEVNAVATNATMIQSLTKQLSKLQSQLESKKNLEQDNYNLTKQIEALQKLILNGFGQRTTTDFTGSNRRKTWCAPRRATISSLHPIEEDVVPTVPKFCTPVLKYNPMTIPGVSEFMPIQNANKLTTVSEEHSSQSVITPPRDKRVNFNDEVIELDSDDDDTLDVQTCSPYHKCYGSSKTPPCILRKNAQQAEKNLQDLVVLTEREKIYTPNTVELLEKLEQNTNVITRLEDEVNSLTKKCKEKDAEVNQFIEKIAKTEEDIKTLSSAKADLESLCKDYNTKLTDWEVSYETIKKKAKVREEELLSLLNEQNINKASKDSGVSLSKTIEKELSHFMNMSKDISLVNSESSIIIPDEDESNLQIQDLVTDLQTQLATKNKMIIELEGSIYTQKQRIESLESSSQELQQIVTNFNEKLSNVENEKSLLMSTIDTLNSTIKGQKDNLEIAHKDMESYNNLIQELQVKLLEKERVKIDDSVLEKMIANEEIFIANNENIKNIITSFKIALDCRNEEINNLKSTLLNNTVNTSDGKSLKKLLEEKEFEIHTLMEEVKTIKIQFNEHISKINILINEKNDVENSNLQLSQKLNVAQERYERLESDNIGVLKQVDNLKQNIEILSSTITEKNLKEKDMLTKNENLTNQIGKLTQNVIDLESVITLKDNVIDTLKKADKDTEKYSSEAKTVVEKFQKILSILTGDTPKFPEIRDVLMVFSILSDSLNTLETTAIEIITQNNSVIENNFELNKKVSVLLEKHKDEITTLNLQIENLTKSLNEVKIQNEDLLKQRHELTEHLQTHQKALDTKDNEIEELKKKNCKIEENHMTLRKEIDNLHDNLKTKEKACDQILQAKDTKIINLEHSLKEMERYLEEKSTEMVNHTQKLNDCLKNRDLLLDNIFKEISNLTHDCDIENSLSCQLENNNVNLYEQMIVILNKVANYITLLKSKNDEYKPNLEKALSEAKKEIIDLTQQNLKLIDNVSKIDKKNETLVTELEKMKVENTNLFGDLSKTNNTLECLQNELQQKAKQIEDLEIKIKCWKEQVITLNRVMRQEKYELQAENTDLKLQYMELERLTKMQHEILVEPECFPSHIIRNIQTDDVVTYSPKSLLTLCCNRIIEALNPSVNDDKSVSTSNSSLNFINSETQMNICQCNQLSITLKAAQEENKRFKDIIERLECENKHLIEEQEEVRKEVKLLLEPAIDLQKKITNHRTNLSTLTATTYAENKLLKSQLKVLQHHHKRYHNLCEKDIPAFKKQLQDLMTILKDTSVLVMQNASLKRFSLSDVLDKSSTRSNFKNESTLDGDLLMLDTNVTLTTAADNTQMGCDQTCLDMSQICLDYDVPCQTSSLCQLDQNKVITQMEVLTSDNQKMFEIIETLKLENSKLQEQVNEYTEIINNKLDSTRINTSFSDTLSPNNENNIVQNYVCEKCKNIEEFECIQKKLNEEIKILIQELSDVKEQKAAIEKKYNDLSLEIPSTEAVVRKMSSLEKEYNNLKHETVKLQTNITNKNKEIKQLQEENETLSNQIMENISEVDDLRKELDTLKTTNVKNLEKSSEPAQVMQPSENAFNSNDVANCIQCLKKDELIQTLHTKYSTELHQKLNRSHSDSDSSSRYNKICTLQNELHASREDCKIITAEVDTIKNHLERSNLSISENMDLDESMGESNIFTCTKNFDGVDSQLSKFNMPNIPEERPIEIYNLDKMDCFNYYVEKTGADKENFDHSIKIIDVMKMLYNNLTAKHSNEIENLVNKLKDFEESKSQLQTQLNEVTTEYTKAVKVLEEKYDNIKTVMNTLSQIKQNIEIINAEISNNPDIDKDTKIVSLFKENLLKVLDTEFGLCSTDVFKSVIDKIVSKHQKDLNNITNQYTKLQEHMECVTTELNTVNENLIEMTSQMSDKEKEYNLLQTQKERVVEISNAVTLDIIKKEQELSETIKKGCQKLLEYNIVSSDDIDMTLPINKNIDLLFERLIIQSKNHNISDLREEKKNLIYEIENSKMIIQKKEKELETLKVQNEKMQEINKGIILDLVEKENNIQSQKSLHDDLNKVLENLTQEIDNLKEVTLKKEIAIQTLESKLHEQVQNRAYEIETEMTELVHKIKSLEEENYVFKHLNKIITEEKDNYVSELEKSAETIKHNTIELDKMMSDVLVLRESVKENVSAIESLKLEAKLLLTQNVQLKEQLEKKGQDCSRLELDIKTHEKTAEIQNNMIIRLQKQKDEDSKILSAKDRQLEELTHKCVNLQKECEAMKDNIKNLKEEIDGLKNLKESLEARVSELASELEAGYKHRQSIDDIAENSRRRRQSTHDSRRTFAEEKHDVGDNNKIEALFTSRAKPDDLFMDIDDASSFRSTPIRLSKGRDSLPPKLDQSDKDEEHPSRPSSVLATRKRRQSTHDSHRNTLLGTTEPESQSNKKDSYSKPDATGNTSADSEVSQLREQLASCQQELEELKEKCRELDEECETCAEYLHERDEQYMRLKKEKTALEQQVSQLKETLQSANSNRSKLAGSYSYAHAAVNTDEDWSNLHSVVVDRMSFDAEVEKNKKLTKAIEEFRLKNRDLKSTLAKMQKSMEKNAMKDNSATVRELELTKSELQACKQELEQLREKCKELDEECETCAEYLREREEQCRRLKEAKAALETKLQELQDDVSNITHSVRKKRQSLHDQNRDSTLDLVDAATETSDDFLSYQVERDESSRRVVNDAQFQEVRRLKLLAEKLSHQKTSLENELMRVSATQASHPVYVATGSAIVQNQHMTDIMKENQKLKKINAKLVNICKKRGKATVDSNRENDDTSVQG